MFPSIIRPFIMEATTLWQRRPHLPSVHVMEGQPASRVEYSVSWQFRH